ncbi:gamma-glutamyl-gamma-aminobutyrate hydrolase family protein [Shewanella sp. GXUN23E]|uniref:gamma-glutamyl-gamma-aminobutyrate hydrolase family protein n=1 Tax=Shewanella sp. GXUN23E TaxID=3422498 RepID=UPI003D7EC250
MATSQTLIGVTACNEQLGLHPFNIVGVKYLLGITDGAGGWPLIIPSLGAETPVAAILERIDGLMVTGSPSNVEPHHYLGPASDPGTKHDALRDATTLPLIRAAVDAGVPLLCICRGFQEMNVAFGGSLHQKLHETGRFMEHREDKSQSLAVQYGLAHTVTLEPGGLLFDVWGRSSAEVNSVHTQGIDRLASGLRPEACTPDGLIEAVSVKNASNFALGVQFHPEWEVTKNAFYLSIFKAFGEACQHRAQTRVR